MNFLAAIRRPLRYRQYNATLYLIGVTVAAYFFVSVLAPRLFVYLAMVPGLVARGWVWQLLTYLFVHGGIGHLFFNMLGLFFFGPYVEREMGSSEFLAFYLGTGTLAGLFSFAAYGLGGAWGVPLVGASGAIFAVLLAFAAYHPHAEIYVYGLFPVRAPWLVVGYTVLEVVSQLFSVRSGVAHLTHLAGFGFAYLYLSVRLGINPAQRFFPRR